MDPPPPPYKALASASRSRTSRGNVRGMADSMLRATVLREESVPANPSLSADHSITDEGTSAQIGASSAASDSASVVAQPISPQSQTASPISSLPSPTITINPAYPNDSRRASLTSSQYLPFTGSSSPVPKKQSGADAQRMRMLEEENAKLKREIEQQSYVSNKAAKQRVAQLRNETKQLIINTIESNANTSSSLKPKGLFKSACCTDLLFLIDCTNSMRRSIDTVKANLTRIVRDISKAFYNEAEVRIAVVAYRDHGAEVNIEALDFTTSTATVVTFLQGLQTYYGHDIPEDVLGGIHKALNMSWDQPTRCIIHIGDAPPHARVFQEEPYNWDRFETVGSEPHGLTYQPLFQLMHRMGINYALLPINKSTDRMAFIFSQVYLTAGADVKLNPMNKYIETLNGLRQEKSQTTKSSVRTGQEGNLTFVVAEMGTIYTYLRNLVVKSVLSSATRTATRLSQNVGTTMNKATNGHSGLVSIDELGLDSDKPQWDVPTWFEEVIPMEGFSPDVIMHGKDTLNSMMRDDEKIKMSTTDLTIHKRSKAFAHGALRLAFYGRTAHSLHPYVVKSFFREGKQLAHLVEEMRCQALCKAFALEFNALTGSQHAIDFVVTVSLRGKSEKDERLSLEPFIQGEYVKYNNNCGYVNETIPNDSTNQAAQAFSHFTFERSRGQFLISDLQGVGSTFTDPAIHARDELRFQLADTNLGVDGFKFFFATHECNSVCRSLQLMSNAEMVLSGNYRFRETWPAINSTVCCSNKLCGKIVSLELAHKATRHPGFYWCDGCSPQLDRTRVRRACVGPGPYHTFEVSAFFYESQGRMTPRTCNEHRKRDETVRPPSMDGGGGIFKRLGFGR